ncbi:hypothetical protein MOO45_05295 [Bombilactobacillus folatiphilus]|uniref:Uncharacterized protein n=1 Tax=Bombilactobacillus folatiphilus TaxID=2923362 RepID=A0ABY4P7G1_9LACO|nr:hypothetical protein [Bombilactobacillus folatiphilus]UQS81634.1 hypothetical protein MOO45_05295 [Bombilactobacillus folatiphilus]
MKKKTVKAMIKQSKVNHEKIYARITFSDGRILTVPVKADDQVSIDDLKRKLRDKDGSFTGTDGLNYDLRNLIHYEFIE